MVNLIFPRKDIKNICAEWLKIGKGDLSLLTAYSYYAGFYEKTDTAHL